MDASRASTRSRRSESLALPRTLSYPKVEASDPEFNPTRERIAKSNSPLREWLFELISLIASVLCLSAVLMLLLFYRNKALPELSMGLTFNAMISLLITAAKAAMLSAVGSAMGQIKWNWFRQNRSPLRNLDLFDEASRGGPWGALYFLARVKWSSTAAIGAMVLLLSLAMNPFAQQLLTYPVQITYRDSPDASINTATAIDPRNIDFDNIVQRYVTDAIWNNPRTFTTSCSSGNCIYPPFQSISWCTRCEDITNDVILQGCDMFDFASNQTNSAPLHCNISISSGRNLTTWHRAITYFPPTQDRPIPTWHVEPALTYVWEIVFGESSGIENPIPFLGQSHNMLGLGQVDLIIDPAYPFQALKVKHAMGCVMNPCIRQHTVRTNAGAISAESIKTSDGIVAMVSGETKNLPIWFPLTHEVCWVANHTLLPKDSKEDASIENLWAIPEAESDMNYCANGNIFSKCTIDPQFILDLDMTRRIAIVIIDLFSGNKTTYNSIFGKQMLAEYLTAYSSDGINGESGEYYTSYNFEQMLKYRGLNATLQSVAESLTAMMQNLSNDTITGQVGYGQAFVHVQWLWLLYPVVVIFIGIVFVLFTIAETTWIGKGTTHVWKNSSLPLVYHGLLEGVDERIRVKTMEMRDMEMRASETIVRFEGTGLKRV